MRKSIVLFFGVTISQLLYGQIILIDKTDSAYVVNEKMLTAKDKKCQVVNCIWVGKDVIADKGVTPFVLFKVFDYDHKGIIPLKQKPEKAIRLSDFVNSTVIPILRSDLVLRVENLGSVYKTPNIREIDSIVTFDGNKYELLVGAGELSFYNLFDFKQTHIQQSNQTIINTKANIAPIVKSSTPGVMLVNIDKTQQIDPAPKMYLIKRANDLYTFRLVILLHNEDDPLDYFQREFVFKKGYGVTAFKSPYFYKMNDAPPPSYRLLLVASDEYYDFK